jgi:ABC-type antimicrobial peptide transport system permease subunit
VVGVLEDVRVNSLREPPTPMMYFSADQATLGSFYIVVRAANPGSVMGALRAAVRDVRATLPVTRLTTLTAYLGGTLSQARLAALLLGGFSLLGLLLAGLGVYAVVSFGVERRTQEMGIRAALGASSALIMRMVIGESLVSVGIGLGLGLALATLATRGLSGMLFGVEAGDPATFAAAAALLLGAAGIGAWGPARRAGRADPIESLRKH